MIPPILPRMNNTPFVRQYVILKTSGVFYYGKRDANKRYTPEFKTLAAETMCKDGLSVREVMRHYAINDHKIIERWERIYLEETEGLKIERRGRRKKYCLKKLPTGVEENLLAELQRLRAENDSLKNLQALVLEDE